MWSMKTTNKGHLINKPNKWYQMIPKGHLSLIDYFWLFLPMIVNFWLSFDDCFLLEFWLSFMIMFVSYDDCVWWLFFMILLDWVLIVFDDCFLLSFDCLWWLFFMIVFYWVLIVLDNCLWELWLLITFDDIFLY